MERVIKISNESGLHARPAAIFVKTASQFNSGINIEFNGSSLNAKSIMNILSLGLKKGDEIKIIVNGTDEEEAIETLVKLIESKFGEA
ncbi:HPr family phosphocarrier protein [Wukongibacter baidiensis]|uniref:HPr family phosphocarrier protein n=1 Tax=Wukongibacter baidiensis TaxID=1723361 RepID=UPI003D7FF55F